MHLLIGILICTGLLWTLLVSGSFRILLGIAVLIGALGMSHLIGRDNQAAKEREKREAEANIQAAQRREAFEAVDAERWDDGSSYPMTFSLYRADLRPQSALIQ